MNFTSQVSIGMKMEFKAAKNFPLKTLQKFLSVYLTIFLSIVLSYFPIEDTLVGKYVGLIHSILYFSPTIALMGKVSKEREISFPKFAMANGMTKMAYILKVIISNYIPIIIISVEKGIETFCLTNYKFRGNLDLLLLILSFTVASIGVVNMALFISSVLESKNAKITSYFVFVLMVASCAFLQFKPTFPDWIFYSLSFLNPGGGLVFLLGNFIYPDDPKKKGRKEDLFTGCLFVIIASGLFYLILFLWKERTMQGSRKANRIGSTSLQKNSVILQKEDVSLRTIDENSQSEKSQEIQEPFLSEPILVKLDDNENPPSSLKKTIEIKGLKKEFEDTVALDEIDLTVYEAEVICLLGHNGAGKSTLVNILTGLVSPTEGSISFNSKEVNADSIFENIGYCAQTDIVLMDNSVYENMRFFARLRGLKSKNIKSEVDRVLSKLKLTPYKKVMASQLSGGLRRKLSIAIALINDPKILILDEPTSGLDAVSRRAFWEIIEDLKMERKTIVFTTQFLEEAEKLADRVAVLSKGKLFAIGSVEYIKKRFGAGYTLIFLNSKNPSSLQNEANKIESTIKNYIPMAIRQSETNLNMLKFSLPFDQREQFTRLFSELERIPDIQINLQMTSLEEAFVRLEFGGFDQSRSIAIEEQANEELPSQNVPINFFAEKQATFGDHVKSVLFMRYYKWKMDRKPIFNFLFCFGGVIIFTLLAPSFVLDIKRYFVWYYSSDSLLLQITLDFLIRNEANGITEVLRVMGMKPFAYWFGNIIADILFKVPIFVSSVVGLFTIDSKLEILDVFVWTYFVFSASVVTFFYTLGSWFKKTDTALLSSPIIFLLANCPPFIIRYLFGEVLNETVQQIVLCLFFVFCLCFGLPAFSAMFIIAQMNSDLNLPILPHLDQLWPSLVITSIGTMAQFFSLVYRETRAFQQKDNPIFIEAGAAPSTMTDQNAVNAEKTRLNSATNEDMIKAIGVQKVFENGFKALYDLSFGVEKGQIFCLLGPTGAGKTTTFKIITKKIATTYGKFEIKERDKKSNRLTMGICLEHNSLWNSMTVRQHLKLYATLRGLKGFKSEEAIQSLIRALGLETNADKAINKLSGGTKRKVCAAIAVIGGPDIVLLDEPTTGVDPVGRGQIWSLLKGIIKMKPVTVVLSTHYVDDAELVGDKIGILVNGSFATIGTVPELRKKYEDYLIVVDGAAEGATNEIEQVIKRLLPKARIDPNPDEKGLVFKTPARSMKFSKVFHELESLKSREKIKDFSIYTTTLEQIFLRLSQKQVSSLSQ